MIIDTLPEQYQRCIAEYMHGLNWTEAYHRVYGGDRSRANKNAHVVYNRPEVKAAIKELIEQRYLTESETLMQLSKIARGEIGKYITDGGDIDFKKIREEGNGFLLKKVKRGKAFNEWEAVDPLKALEMLLKVYKTFDDKPVVNVNVNYESLDDKLEKLREKIANQDS